MSVIFKNKREFELEGFIIPEFEINNSDFIRFWIELVNFENNRKIDCFKFIKNFKRYLVNESNFVANDNYTYNKGCFTKIYQLFFNYKLKDYLKKQNIDNHDFSNEIRILNLNLSTNLKDLDLHLLKVLEIIITIHKNNNVVVDYFGLGANAEKILTPYIKEAVLKNKTIIVLDNFSFKIGDCDYNEKIKNIGINQTKIIKEDLKMIK